MSDPDQNVVRRAYRTLNAASRAVSENHRWVSRVRENWDQHDKTDAEVLRLEGKTDNSTPGQ